MALVMPISICKDMVAWVEKILKNQHRLGRMEIQEKCAATIESCLLLSVHYTPGATFLN
jgi:hypothetical protein